MSHRRREMRAGLSWDEKKNLTSESNP